MKKFLLAALLLFAALTGARADEDIFAFTYTTDLLPKGKWEFEHWTTGRWEKEAGIYNVIEFREEIEYGVTDNFQLSLYLNHHYVNAKNDFPAENPLRPGRRLPGAYVTGGEDVHAGHDPLTPYESYHFESVSVEGIYRLLSPYKNFIGLALYVEPEWGPEERGVEMKLLLQKDWLEDRLVWALNLNYAYEEEKNDIGGFERNGDAEWFTGLSYRFARNWFGGFEFWNHHEFAGLTIHEHSAYFVGPTLHYGGQRWWVTLGYLRQLPFGQTFDQDNKEFAGHDGYVLGEEHEKNYLRLKFGVNF